MKVISKKSLLKSSPLPTEMNGEWFITSKAFIISSVLILGSGAVFIIYQQYEWSRRQRSLSTKIVQLQQHIMQLESDIKQIKETAVTSSSTDEMEEVFVDASEVAQDMIDMPREPESDSSTTTMEDVSRTSEQFSRLCAKIDHIMERGGSENLTNVHATLTELANKNPQNAEIQWRLAKASFLLASEDMFTHPDKPQEGQRDLMQKAHDAAAAAVDIDKENGDAHKWLAIIIGSITQFLPIQEQIKNAFNIKEHVQAAIKYKPRDALSYHMLGRWCYSVYMLSWVERKVASTLFAVPPTATLDEAMTCFLKAEDLNPESSIDNALYLAKGYIAKQDYKTAVSWLRVGSSIPSSSRDDMKSQNEIQSLLTQYESYS
uniref:Regulator of microtubule dynamics protein 1 n=1 Tax=Arion vulgaris TaxID=1028688 RepID=A0A0B7A4C6_9EUPU